VDSASIRAEVIETIADVTFNDIEDVVEGKPVPNWDSAAQVMIIATLEDKFSIDFTPEEISTLNSIELLTESIAGKRAN